MNAADEPHGLGHVGQVADAREGRAHVALAGLVGAHDHAQRFGRMEIIVHDLHLALGKPVHAGDRIEGKAVLIENRSGRDYLLAEP